MPEAEAAADSIIEQARLQGGGRVSGHWEKVRAGQAGRRIIEEAQDMRAAAVVIDAAAADRGHVGVRQDARDGARRAAVPRDHRVAPAGAAGRAARAREGEGALVSPITLVLSGLMVVLGIAMIARTLAGGGGPLAVGLVLGLLFVAAGAGRLWVERRR